MSSRLGRTRAAYVMLAPLSKGEHTLHIEVQNDGFALDVTYHLTVDVGKHRR